MDERPTKEELMMQIAKLVSERGTCERLKVGCIITNYDMTEIISYGYNGNYAGGPNTCDSEEPGKCGCIHGEINALLKSGRKGQIMFCTDAPCINCAKLIINSGIEELYYDREYRLTEGIDLLKDHLMVRKLEI